MKWAERSLVFYFRKIGKRIMASKRVPCPNPWNLLLLLYMAKGTLQICLSEGSKDGEIILDYPSGLKLITWVIKSTEISLGQDKGEMVASEGPLNWEDGGRDHELEKWQPLELRKGLWKWIQLCWYFSFIPVRPVSDFWLIEL